MTIERKDVSEISKDGIEKLNDYLDQKEKEAAEVQNTEVTKKENKVWKWLKFGGYAAAFGLGAIAVAVLSHLGDDKDEEPKSIEDLTDIDKVIEEAKKDPEVETVEF